MKLQTIALITFISMVTACTSNKIDEAPRQTSVQGCNARDLFIYFDQWQYKLSPESAKLIAALQKGLQGCKIDHVKIVGLADAVGDEAANMKVSQQRADTIAHALEKGGWSRSQFEVVAVGDKGATVQGVEKPMRRRAHITVQAS